MYDDILAQTIIIIMPHRTSKTQSLMVGGWDERKNLLFTATRKYTVSPLARLGIVICASIPSYIFRLLLLYSRYQNGNIESTRSHLFYFLSTGLGSSWASQKRCYHPSQRQKATWLHFCALTNNASSRARRLLNWRKQHLYLERMKYNFPLPDESLERYFLCECNS